MSLSWIKQVIGQDISGDWLTKVSSDGTKFLVAEYEAWNGQVTGNVYTSNGDNTWQVANIDNGRPVYLHDGLAISGNGQYMLVGEYDGRLYLSINGGVAWNEIRPNGVDESLYWWAAAISDSGQYMLVGDYSWDNLYLSTDYGASWTLVNEGTGYAETAYINDSGSIMVAAGYGGVFISTNYGATWTENDFNYDYWNLRGVSGTATGDVIYMLCDENNGSCLIKSLDYGATWSLATIIEGISSTCSDDNSIILVADHVDGLKSSIDGINWVLELPNMYDVSSDGAGIRIICGQEGGYVYITGLDTAPINLDDIYAKKGHTHPYAPPADYMINGRVIHPLDIRPTGSYYSSAGEIGAGTGIPHRLRLANGGVVTLTVRGGIVTYIG